MPKISNARFFAETLRGYGVTHMFYVPAIAEDSIVEMNNLKIKCVLTHSELSAAYMADGYARASQSPGIVMAQKVGASNLAAGLRDAYLSFSPVIAFSEGTHPNNRYRNQYQHLEDFNMFDAVTKLNIEVEKTERLPDLMRQAFQEATTGSPGPVHLSLSAGTAEMGKAKVNDKTISEMQFSKIPTCRPEPSKQSIAEAVKLLISAERPAIVAGRGVVISGGEKELLRLAENLSIPVAYSLNAKEVIPNDHPLSVGPVGLYSRWCSNRIVSEADLVFFIGTRAGSMVTNSWTIPPASTTIIQLDISPSEIGRNYPVKVGLVGDAKAGLSLLVEAIDKKQFNKAWTGRVQKYLKQWHIEMESRLSSDEVPIRPERLCREITNIMPETGVVVACTSHAAIWTSTLVSLNSTEQKYIRCAGTLGWGFPGAIGVKCAMPEKTVFCFTGDGGLYYHLSELETAARLGINIIVIVNNNGILAQSTTRMRKAFGDNLEYKAIESVSFRPVNFASIAQELGCIGLRVEKPANINSVLKKAILASTDRPVLVDVFTDKHAMPDYI